jgi:hypothetical protein
LPIDKGSNRKNRREKNPKKLIWVIVLLAIGCLAVVTEKLLAVRNDLAREIPPMKENICGVARSIIRAKDWWRCAVPAAEPR